MRRGSKPTENSVEPFELRANIVLCTIEGVFYPGVKRIAEAVSQIRFLTCILNLLQSPTAFYSQLPDSSEVNFSTSAHHLPPADTQEYERFIQVVRIIV